MLEQYDIALEKDPNDMTTLYWRGLQLAMAGYLDEALEVMYQCLDIDPMYRNCLVQTGDFSLLLGDVETFNTVYATLAEQYAVELTTMQVPLELAAGNRRMAVIVAAHASGLHGSPFQLWLDALEQPYADHGRAWEEYRAWAESAGEDLRAYPDILVAFGQYDQVDLRILASTFHWIPHFAPFRASDSFKQQMRKYGYLKLWQAKGFPAMCRPVGTDDFECD